jgi:hypothetical protein
MVENFTLVVVGVLVALGGAYMAEGWWGAITALGFILMGLGWGGHLTDQIIRGVKGG